MGNLSRNFSSHEFRCKCGKCSNEFIVDDKLIRILQGVRDVLGPLKISSGKRCAEHNKAIGGAKSSWHILRKGRLYAADFMILDPRSRDLKDATRLYIECDLRDAHGLGLYSNPGRVHVDTRPITIFKGADRARWIDKGVEFEA